jgi:hypothetical protein
LAQELTNQQQKKHSRSFNFVQFIAGSLKGIGFEMKYKKKFSHMTMGISYINIKSVGECCCGNCSQPNDNEIVFLTAGSEDLEEKIFHYLTGSLFDIVVDDEDQDQEMFIKPRDNNGVVNEDYGLKRYGAFFFDNLFSAYNLLSDCKYIF